MKRKHIVIWVGVVGVGILASACDNNKELKDWATQMYGWQDKIGKAVCNLESKAGLNGPATYCNGGPYPPSDTPPPKYPPR